MEKHSNVQKNIKKLNDELLQKEKKGEDPKRNSKELSLIHISEPTRPY